MFTDADKPTIFPAEGITWNLQPLSLELYTDSWRVIWYESPTGHRFVGISGDGDALIRYLKVADSRGELLAQVEDKWRWLNENPMYKRGWGKLTRRQVQRGVDKPEEPEVHGKLVFGQPLPDTGKRKRKRR